MRIVLFILALLAPLVAFAGDKAGLIYAEDSGAIRRILVPDNDADLSKPTLLDPGEAMLIVDKSALKTVDDPYTLVAKVTGKDAHPTPVAVVNMDGAVEQLIMADPVIDKLPGKTLIKPTEGVSAGDTYDAGAKVFLRCGQQVVATSAKDCAAAPALNKLKVP